MKVMVDPAFPDHRKVRALGRALGVDPMQALGHVVALWCRVMKECPSGDIRAWDDHDIADAAHWRGDAKKLVTALRSKPIRFLERDEVHDWVDEQGDLVAQRESWRKEKARQRAAARAKAVHEDSPGCPPQTDACGNPVEVSGKTGGGVLPESGLSVPFPSRTTTSPSVPVVGHRRARASTSTHVEGTPLAGGTGDADRLVVAGDGGAPVLDGLLAQVSHPHSLQLLKDAGVRGDVADRFARTKPVGYVLAVVQAAREKENPGGYAVTVLEKDYPAPAMNGPANALEREALVKALAAADGERRTRLAKHFAAGRPAPERRPDESEDEYLRRIQREKSEGSK
jgi:hypothetical protein